MASPLVNQPEINQCYYRCPAIALMRLSSMISESVRVCVFSARSFSRALCVSLSHVYALLLMDLMDDPWLGAFRSIRAPAGEYPASPYYILDEALQSGAVLTACDYVTAVAVFLSCVVHHSLAAVRACVRFSLAERLEALYRHELDWSADHVC